MRLTSRIIPVIFFGVLFTGCSDGKDATIANAELPAAPVSFQEAVLEIVSLRDTIRDGFAADDVDAAHDPLHAVGARLTKLPQIAESADLDTDELILVGESVESLMDAFGAVDATLHGREGSTYDDEAGKIDAAIANLSSIAQVAAVVSPSETLGDE